MGDVNCPRDHGSRNREPEEIPELEPVNVVVEVLVDVVEGTGDGV
jgi:hypothetical protein